MNALAFADRTISAGSGPVPAPARHGASPLARMAFGFGFALAYPLALAAEALKRRQAGIDAPDQPPARSVFAEARESTFIAMSYAFMARTTLQQFARHNRVKRQS